MPTSIVSDRGKELLNETMKKLCEMLGVDHSPTSSYHPQSNAQAETYNKTMIHYLSSMLDSSETLDWELLLPAMTMAYNSHVHRATGESPFLLTYFHLPKLPFFNLDKPRPLYGESYVENAYRTINLSYNAARNNLKEAEKIREEYFNRKSEKRSFAVGDRVLVKVLTPKVAWWFHCHEEG